MAEDWDSRRANSGRGSGALAVAFFVVTGAVMFLATVWSRPAPEQPAQPPAAEATLAEQAAAVRAGLDSLVRVDHALVTDDDLALLDGLEDKLVRLNLSRTTISDAGLERLSTFSKLEQLRLRSGALTDEGVSSLGGSSNLRHLHLIGVLVTDAGLDKLQVLSKLESLYLDGARVTDEGVERFAKARPDVHLHLDGGHHPGDPHADNHEHDGKQPSSIAR